jgi:hypothetical protein
MAELVIDRFDPDGHGETAGAAPVTRRPGLWISLAADRGHYALEAELGNCGLRALP